MNVNLTADQTAFRDEVREFFVEKYPADLRQKQDEGVTLDREDTIRWQKLLNEQGWFAVNWPEEYGGTGWSSIQKYIFANEMAAVNAPLIVPFGVAMVAPVIYTFGSEEQKQRFLPDILASNVWWCQGYSEPGSGSDLASLKTKAERDGDKYIVNGTKTWTTLGHLADWIFCLVRTSSDVARRQEGISFLLIDMSTPGVSVKPIITIEGDREVNEIHFDNVSVPVENLVGEENQGWTYAKYLLGHERAWTADIGQSKNQLGRIRKIAAEELVDGKPLLDDPVFQTKIAEVEIDLLALESVLLQVLAAEAAGQPPGPEASLLKLRGTEIQQAITELLFEAVGNYAHPFVRDALEIGWNEEPIGPDYAAAIAPRYFSWRKSK